MNEHLRSAFTWIHALPVQQQREAGTYYCKPHFAEHAFDLDFGSQKLRDIGGRFFPYYDLDGSAFRFAAAHLNKHRAGFILAKVSTHSLYSDGHHSVGFMIDGQTGAIHHQDPHGDPIRFSLRKRFGALFPGFTIVDYQTRQQRDRFSCALITLCNLVALARNEEPDPDIDDKLMGIRAAHAPHFLNICHERAAKRAAETPADPLQRLDDIPPKAWGSVVEAITKRDTSLLASGTDEDPHMLEFLFRLAPNHQAPAGV